MTASSHGPRARVGLIVPSSNRQVEQEMLRRFPRDVQPHVTRLRMTGPHHVPLAELLPRVREAAAALDDARCDVVMFHCTATAMEDGPEGEAAVLDALREGARRAVGTTATAIDAALAALAARRIVLVSPYDDRTNATEASFLERAGYEVVSSVATDLDGTDAYCSTPSSFWYETTIAAAHPGADAYLISCANIACFEVIERLERELERPVVTSNQAVLWYALRRLGNVDPLPLGRLFTSGCG